MSESIADVAGLKAWKEAHEDRCKERYDANARDLGEIKAALLSLSADLKGTVQRLHERSDMTAKDINGVAQALSEDIATANARIDKQKIWTLTSLLSAAGAIIAWLAEHAWSPVK